MDLNQLLTNNPALQDKFNKLPEADRAIIMQQLGTASGEGAQGKVFLDPSLTPAEKKDALVQTGVLQGFQPTTPGQQLREDNNPITKGLQAAGGSASKGILGTLAAPGVGLGDAAGTTAQNILGNIPGLGGPAGIIPSAGAALANAGGTMLGDTVTGNLVGKGLSTLLAKAPGAFVDAINAVRAKGVTGAVSDALPTITKEGKVNQVAKTVLDQPATFGERVANPVSQEAKNLYKLAEVQRPLAGGPASDLTDSVFQAYQKEKAAANPNALATKTMEGLFNKFSNNPQLTYNDVLEEAQRLRQTASGLAARQPQAAATLNELRQSILGTLDATSPVARQAGQLWRKDMLAKDVLETLRGANPGAKIRNMLEQDSSIAQTFGLDTPAKIEAFAKSADKIGSASTRAQLLKKVSIIGGAGGLLSYAIHRKIFDTMFHE